VTQPQLPALPAGWCWIEARQLIDRISAGKSFKCEERPPQDGEIGVVKVSAVTWGSYNEEESKTCTREALVNPELFVQPGDFLFSRANTIELVGACVIADRVTRKVMLSDKILRFSVRQGWEKWLLWSLRSSHGRAEIERLATGNQESMRNIGQERVLSIRLPLPANGEQHRIVEEIESYFTRLDDAVATLERVERNLKRYRASVLKAAVEGRLVPTEAALARREGRTYEPASVLLERILDERRRRWSESGKKGKYQEPTLPDTTDLPDLPEGWCWATLDQLTTGDRPSSYGVLVPGPDVPDGVPLIRVGDIRDGRVHLDEIKRIARDIADKFQRTYLKGGELLISLVGSIGRTAVVPGSLAGANVARAVGVVPVTKLMDCRWVEHWFRSPQIQLRMITLAHEVARKTLNLEDVRSALVAVPPRHEQSRIVGEVSDLETLMEESQRLAGLSRQRLARLRQAILKWAFEGKLADQNANDEPASALLERIKAEQGTAKAERPTRRRGAGKEQVRA
jgi:type I restriction enzyme, S subunit